MAGSRTSVEGHRAVNDWGRDESLSNMYASVDWGVDPGVPSHLRPQAAGEYLTGIMVPKLWKEIHEMKKRMRTWPAK